ncbi:MAG TPA: zf-HC2 domain-containing protein [Anaerohalosphaeraceae bacterium]|nr:zf-HC2 domain-containing protein [Anaerohalosphaeraceae bacterium]
MNHKHIQNNLAAYVLGELDSAAAEQIRTHLSDCADCRRTAEEMQNVLRTAERMKAEPLDASLPALARRRLDETIRRLPSASLSDRLSHPLLRYAAAAVILAGALLALHILGPQTLPDRRSLTADTQQTDNEEAAGTLRKELEQAAQAFRKRDIRTLARLLQSEYESTRLAAADYLAQIGDASVLPALDTLARRWTGSGENPYQKAAQTIRNRPAEPAD